MTKRACPTGAAWLGFPSQAPDPGGTALFAASRLCLVIALALALTGCLQTEPYVSSGFRLPGALTDPSQSLLPLAREALRAGHQLEHQGSDESVDQYYRAAVYSYAAITVTAAVVGMEHPDALEARDIYNEGLRDCLRAAQEFSRIDARSHLTVNTPAGAHAVPIAHRGFVWKPGDFGRLVDPTRLDRNPNQHGV